MLELKKSILVEVYKFSLKLLNNFKRPKGYLADQAHHWLRKNEEAMYAALKDGPISVAVDGEDWPYYQSGVITNCGTHMDHSAVIVGYQKEEDAWVVRNSWGKIFGEDGHIRLKYGQNTCLVTYKPAFPDV